MDTNCAKWLEFVRATLIESAERMHLCAAGAGATPPDAPRRGGRPSSRTVSAGGLVGSARALAAAALLALTGALALPAPAEAQTATTLVSNVDKTPVGYFVDRSASQRFTTGSNPSGYILTGVDIVSATNTALTIELCETDTSGGPTSTCTELTPPSMFAKGTMSYTVPAGTTLTQDTTYSVETEIYWEGEHGFTTDDGEDAADGWSIADAIDIYDPVTESWTPLSNLSGQALRIAINGYAVGGGTPSSDATLSALTVTAGGTDLVTFVSGTTDYTPMVANDVAEVTVTAMTTDSGATFEYLDTSDMTLDDADTTEDGFQVALAVGATVIKVKVTAADDSTQTYMVTVDRAEAMSPTCTLNTGDIWCGVVTVGTSSDGVGFLAADTDVGALTDNNGDQTITIGSDSYTISSLLVLSAPAGTLTITLDTKFRTSDVATLEFYIGTKTFKACLSGCHPRPLHLGCSQSPE